MCGRSSRLKNGKRPECESAPAFFLLQIRATCRYDELLGSYHPKGESIPGIGFSFQIDQLYPVLRAKQQLPSAIAASDWLVVAVTPAAQAAALHQAQHLRSAHPEQRVELHLDNGQPLDRAAIADYATARHIPQIAWVSDTGEVTIAPVTQ